MFSSIPLITSPRGDDSPITFSPTKLSKKASASLPSVIRSPRLHSLSPVQESHNAVLNSITQVCEMIIGYKGSIKVQQADSLGKTINFASSLSIDMPIDIFHTVSAIKSSIASKQAQQVASLIGTGSNSNGDSVSSENHNNTTTTTSSSKFGTANSLMIIVPAGATLLADREAEMCSVYVNTLNTLVSLLDIFERTVEDSSTSTADVTDGAKVEEAQRRLEEAASTLGVEVQRRPESPTSPGTRGRRSLQGFPSEGSSGDAKQQSQSGKQFTAFQNPQPSTSKQDHHVAQSQRAPSFGGFMAFKSPARRGTSPQRMPSPQREGSLTAPSTTAHPATARSPSPSTLAQRLRQRSGSPQLLSPRTLSQQQKQQQQSQASPGHTSTRQRLTANRAPAATESNSSAKGADSQVVQSQNALERRMLRLKERNTQSQARKGQLPLSSSTSFASLISSPNHGRENSHASQNTSATVNNRLNATTGNNHVVSINSSLVLDDSLALELGAVLPKFNAPAVYLKSSMSKGDVKWQITLDTKPMDRPFFSDESQERHHFSTICLRTVRGHPVVAKAIHHSQSGKVRKAYLQSISRLSTLSHPSLCRVFGGTLPHDSDPNQDLCVVMERLEGDKLSDLLLSGGGFTTDHPLMARLDLMLDVVDGIVYLHNTAPTIGHLDLRAEHVMLTGGDSGSGSASAKIIDFGLSGVKDVIWNLSLSGSGGESTQTLTFKEYCGGCVAPELLTAMQAPDNDSRGSHTDVFSLGVLIAEIALGERLLANEKIVEQISRHFSPQSPASPTTASSPPSFSSAPAPAINNPFANWNQLNLTATEPYKGAFQSFADESDKEMGSGSFKATPKISTMLPPRRRSSASTSVSPASRAATLVSSGSLPLYIEAALNKVIDAASSLRASPIGRRARTTLLEEGNKSPQHSPQQVEALRAISNLAQLCCSPNRPSVTFAFDRLMEIKRLLEMRGDTVSEIRQVTQSIGGKVREAMKAHLYASGAILAQQYLAQSRGDRLQALDKALLDKQTLPVIMGILLDITTKVTPSYTMPNEALKRALNTSDILRNALSPLNAKDYGSGLNAFHILASHGRGDAIALLLQVCHTQVVTLFGVLSKLNQIFAKEDLVEDIQNDLATVLQQYQFALTAIDGNKWTPLDHAIRWDRADAVSALCTRQCPNSIKSIDDNKDLLFLSLGADIDVGDGMSVASATSSENDDREEMQSATKVDCDEPNHFGDYPIHVAASKGKLGSLKALLQAGATPNTPDECGQTPLHVAVEASAITVIKCLVSEKATKVNATDQFGRTAMHVAARLGRTEAAQTILQNSIGTVDLTIRASDGNIALHDAIKSGCDAMVEAMLQSEGDFAGSSSTSIHQSRIFRKLQALADARDSSGCTSLQIAVLNGRSNIAISLISAGSAIRVLTPAKDTILHLCARYNLPDVAAELLKAWKERGERAAEIGMGGNTSVTDVPLLLGSRKGTRLSMNAVGAHTPRAPSSPNMDMTREDFVLSINGQGLSALSIAIGNFFDEVAKVLITHGADRGTVTTEGDSFLHLIAAAPSDNKVAALAIAKVILTTPIYQPPTSTKAKSTPIDESKASNMSFLAKSPPFLHLDMSALHNNQPRTPSDDEEDEDEDYDGRAQDTARPRRQSRRASNASAIQLPGLELRGGSRPPPSDLLDLDDDAFDKSAEQLSPRTKDVLLRAKDAQGTTPLMIAVSSNNDEIAEFFIVQGAPVSDRDGGGDTALHELARTRPADSQPSLSAKHFKLFIAGFKQEALYGYQRSTPLHYAAYCTNLTFVRQFLACPLSSKEVVNAQTDGGMTALHFGAKSKSTEIVEALLKAGADLSLKNNKGQAAEELVPFDGDELRTIFKKSQQQTSSTISNPTPVAAPLGQPPVASPPTTNNHNTTLPKTKDNGGGCCTIQ